MNDDNFNQNDNDIMAARKWAMWVHLSGLLWTLLSLVIPLPLINLIGPLIIWRTQKDKYELVNEQGKESLNFQLSQNLYFIVSVLLFTLLFFLTCGIGYSNNNEPLITMGVIIFFICPFFYIIMGIFQIAVVIFAAVKAKKGQFYRYPFTIRFLK